MFNWYMEKIKEYEQLLTIASDSGDNNRVAYLEGEIQRYKSAMESHEPKKPKGVDSFLV